MIYVRFWGTTLYQPIFNAMRNFTSTRDRDTSDEIWLLQHEPVFTLGKNANPDDLLDPQDLPVVPSDRGGQVTYHGPGQLIVYFLIDLARKSLTVKRFINIILNTVVEFLWLQYHIVAVIQRDLTGIYVDQAKICSLGLKINKGCTYHGLSLNVAMDLAPFSKINPCGIKGLAMAQLADFCPKVIESHGFVNMEHIGRSLTTLLLQNLAYSAAVASCHRILS